MPQEGEFVPTRVDIEHPLLSVGYVDHALDDRFARGLEMGRWTMGYLISGRVSVQTSQGRQTCYEHTAQLIPPHTPYSVEWGGGPGQWTELYAVFDPPAHWNALLSWPTAGHGLGVLVLRNSPVAGEVEAALTAALEALHSARINRQLMAFNAVEKALLALDEINPQRGHVQREARIEQVLTYIAANYQQPLTVELLAQQVFLSPSRFSHLFKMQVGQAPMQYLEQYRLERAAERLLTSGTSIEQIAEAVGFTNAFHFSTRFRRRFGQPPSRYRLNPK